MTYTKHAQYNAYSAASQTVPKTKQIIMLYDGAIRFMKQARHAIEERRIEDRFHLLNRASEIVVSLQACLDFDNGGEIAHILFDYYSSIDARILNIHRSNDLKLCDSVIDNLKEMRDAWQNIDTAMSEEAEEAQLAEQEQSQDSQGNGGFNSNFSTAHSPMAADMANVLVSA